MALPLEHIRVIDMARVRSGPAAVRQLADMGAQVIQVAARPEGPTAFGTHGSDYQNVNRNKRSLTLNLKDHRGVAIVKRLVQGSDVLVENFRPGVMDRLGLGFETLSATNPRLIYASISGFGEEGPYRDRPGYDQIAQGLGGLMSITGEPGRGPMRAGIPVADLTAGLFLAQGILVALLERERSGRGQRVSTSLLQAMVHMLDFQATRWLVDHEVPPQAGNDHPTAFPTGAFATRDGLINIAATTQAMWLSLCDVIGARDLAEDPRYGLPRERAKQRVPLTRILQERIAGFASENLIQRLNDAGVPAGPILDVQQVFENEQVRAMKMTGTVEHPALGALELLGIPYRLSRTPGAVRTAAPDPGQHTEQILAELGYGPAERQALIDGGVV
jgi:crotonobetainyl-CoA:carnitine CoA-transferase CaiB-like acyl-CoA transferase